MRSMDRRYWCRTRSSILFLGCPLDFELVDLSQAIVGPDLSEWSDRNEVYLAIHLPYDEDEEDEQLKIPDLKNFFTNFDLNVLDQFRDLMKLLGQPENDSEPGLCSCQSNIG
ncbi:8426_t:CDS:2 [Rhizophagus irregularis]|nr:8426_t:CDS:2 [Rhizophagus irregularis]